MENKSLLNSDSIQITNKLTLRIPTVGEILNDEVGYSSLVSIMTSTPFQYAVKLDDIGIDCMKISDYQMFQLFFPIYAKQDISIIFGKLDLSDIQIYHDHSVNLDVLYSKNSDIKIDEFVYTQMAQAMRQIHSLKYDNRKFKNEDAKKYTIKTKRRHLQNRERLRKKNGIFYQQSELEKMIIALVNYRNFKYDYESIKSLSIYNFFQSVRQIQHEINFNNVMHGVYAGTIDTKTMKDKSCLSWIQP